MPHEAGALKEVVEKENINWRSFDDDRTISRQWNSPATPSFYVIDHEGVIRNKWAGHPGKKIIDAVLEEMIREAEEASPRK